MTATEQGLPALRVQAEEGIVRLTLQRPDLQNSISTALLAALCQGLDQAERTPGCRLVVIEGSSGTFCTGMDFGEAVAYADAPDAAAESARRGGEEFLALLTRIATIGCAVIAKVDGRAVGGGVGIAAASDLVYATPRSSFSLPEALWGLLPCCVLPFLIRRTGFQPAAAMALSTLPVTAEQALRTHLVDEVADDPETEVRRVRQRLSKLAPATIADLKRYLRGQWFLSADMEAAAVTEFTRLMSSRAVQDRITDFATRQVFPWENVR
jgi:polyketide biosynthesis enoyl-CoA hydratase PksH